MVGKIDGIRRILRGVSLVALILLAACAGGRQTEAPAPQSELPAASTEVPPTNTEPAEEVTSAVREDDAAMEFTLSSSAFQQGGAIPEQYTCDGTDQSPPLEWSAPPTGTVTLALVMDDPDAPAGTWDHWVLYNLPAGTNTLSAGVEPGEGGPEGSAQGRNSWGNLGYGGPCPPSGTHRYFFRLYALDAQLDLAPNLSKAELMEEAEGHVLGQAELMGTYTR